MAQGGSGGGAGGSGGSGGGSGGTAGLGGHGPSSSFLSPGGTGPAGGNTFAQPVSHPGIQEPVSDSPEAAVTAAHSAHAAMEATTHGMGGQVGAPVDLPHPHYK